MIDVFLCALRSLLMDQVKVTVALKLIKVNSELRSKTLYAERSERIDQLTGVIDQLRSANQMLNLENHCLTAARRTTASRGRNAGSEVRVPSNVCGSN